MALHIVLHEPEIPANTGNIGRTCAASGASLHLIEPFGFILSKKTIRRAGLDYWDRLDVKKYIDYSDFLEKTHLFDPAESGPHLWFATTKGRRLYTEADFGPDDYIMFGKESAGIPEEILMAHPEHCIRIPMLPETRSLNLSNSVAIVLYEALRQNGFAGMQTEGQLHEHRWEDR